VNDDCALKGIHGRGVFRFYLLLSGGVDVSGR